MLFLNFLRTSLFLFDQNGKKVSLIFRKHYSKHYSITDYNFVIDVMLSKNLIFDNCYLKLSLGLE